MGDEATIAYACDCIHKKTITTGRKSTSAKNGLSRNFSGVLQASDPLYGIPQKRILKKLKLGIDKFKKMLYY